MRMWEQFLKHPTVFCRPFTDFSTSYSASKIDLYTDSSRNFTLGCRGYFQERWFFIGWDHFVATIQPSIEYLELFAVTVAVCLWSKLLRNRRIYLFCNNQSAVHMINSSSSSCKNCMVLIRIITLQGLINNVKILAKYVHSKDNQRADALSRWKLQLFKHLTPNANPFPEEIPTDLWPLQKIWLNN